MVSESLPGGECVVQLRKYIYSNMQMWSLAHPFLSETNGGTPAPRTNLWLAQSCHLFSFSMASAPHHPFKHPFHVLFIVHAGDMSPRSLTMLRVRPQPVKWSHVAGLLSGRVGKQCRERWCNHLDPAVKKTRWTRDEDEVLFHSQVIKSGERTNWQSERGTSEIT